MPLGTEVGLGLRDIVFDVDPATPRKGHTQPHPILAHVYWGQMAGSMKTPLGTEVDLGPGHIVVDGVPAPAKGAQQLPLFSAHVYCGHGRPSQLLLSSCYIILIVTARHSSSGHQPNFVAWNKEWNYEFSQRAPPIFGWAAITLGIGPPA